MSLCEHTYNFDLGVGYLSGKDGYLLLSGLSQHYPFLHGNKDVQITPRGHSFTVTGISAKEAQQMQNGWAKIGDRMIAWMQYDKRIFRPSPTLYSPFVLVRMDEGVTEEGFDEGVRSILDEFYPGATFQRGDLRVLPFKEKRFIGWEVTIENLTADQSVLLQSRGLGRWRSCGCGNFRPARLARAEAA